MRELKKGELSPQIICPTPYGEITVSSPGDGKITAFGRRMYVNRMTIEVSVCFTLDENGQVPALGEYPDGSVHKTSGDWKNRWVSDVSRRKVLAPVHDIVANYVKSNPRFAAEGAVRQQVRNIIFWQNEIDGDLKKIEEKRANLLAEQEKLGLLKERLRVTPKSG